MHVNTLQPDFYGGYSWWHRWVNGDAPRVPQFVDKYRVWIPKQQRARDNTTVRHKTGGIRRAA